ncbi:succinyl-CoA synthetase subunit beta [Desulfovibrio aerotolerans]|uniref:Succinyl-CoA synthetase subunit beta n=1 Tax=Solidesulfovibrio aerotolerans TaxID=295255 RepID=A0A7C9MWI0_9BACT|nr:ATP-grasp domain-containing protein [Solidesulfovibrio aerotolerans]MYL84434.1 succinyl-CoA synthetase subunit beta [Solidesulfovibrio aerotolerans]
MLLTEHAGKALLAKAGLMVPPGIVLEPGDTLGDAPPFAGPYFVKAQVLAGGRGKAGGVVRVETAADIAGVAGELFGRRFGGLTPPFLRLEAAVAHVRAVYLSLGVSRGRKSFCLSLGRQGGVEVESLAGTPEMLVLNVPPSLVCPPWLARTAFFHLHLDSAVWPAFEALLDRLFTAVAEYGLLLAEINPLAVTAEGAFVALDAKLILDDNVVALRPDLARFGDDRFATPAERQAAAHGLSFVSLGGRVGLVANGAGLAMATMDALGAAGLPAANFLDFGGTADTVRLRAAFDLLFADPAVTACCVNMYGGILSCADVAEALAAALGDGPGRPVVVRFAGNAAKAGSDRLRAMAGGRVMVADDMDQAVAMLSEVITPGAPAVLPLVGTATCPAPQSDHTPGSPAGGRLPSRTSLPGLLDLGPESGILVQGLTGRAGRAHARRMRAYGGRIVAGVTPWRGGSEVDGTPVYHTVAEAMACHAIDLSILFVPARGAADAVLEAAAAGVRRIVCITDGIPQRDMLAVRAALAGQGTLLLGPNTPGLIVPGRFLAGIMPVEPFSPGPVAIFSRSGTLTYEVASRLSAAGMGQAVAAGIGGDPFGGVGFVDLCELVRDDARVRAVMLIGEVGGTAEEEVAAYVSATGYPKPVVAFVAGLTAPPGRTLGHAGALLERPNGVAEKLDCLVRAGITVCGELGEVAGIMALALCQG